MTSTTVDTEYKLNEDKSTFTKVSDSHEQICSSIPNIRQVTSNFSRSTEYPMPTQGEFFPKKSLSGNEEVCYSAAQMSFGLNTCTCRWEGLWKQVVEMWCKK